MYGFIKIYGYSNFIEVIMDNLQNLGLKIKEIRKKKRISQEKLAEMVSMNTKSILRLENAQNIPTLETLSKISRVLDIKIADLFEIQEFQNREDIIQDISNCLKKMNDEELKKFYKSVYYYIH